MKKGDFVRPKFCPAGWSPYLVQARIEEVDCNGFLTFNPPAKPIPYMQSLFEKVPDLQLGRFIKNAIGRQPTFSHQILKPRQSYVGLNPEYFYCVRVVGQEKGVVYVRPYLPDGQMGKLDGPFVISAFKHAGWLSAYHNYQRRKWVMCVLNKGKIIADLE